MTWLYKRSQTMSKNLIVDKERNIIYDPETGLADVFESIPITGDHSHLVKEAAVEYDVSEEGEQERVHIVPEIVAMVEGRSHNERFYPAKSMKSRRKNPQGTPGGAASFTVPVERPILINHDAHNVTPPFEGIAVGYIESAKFIPGKEGQPAQIKIWPRIVDPKAVEMIKDGRLKSVSIRAKTDKMVCSVCGTDVIEQYRHIKTKGEEVDEEELCKHFPGNKYDGKECYFSTGTLWFQETSFVTIPGVDGARVVVSDVNEDDNSGTKVAKESEIERWLPNISIVDEDELAELSRSIVMESHPENEEEDEHNPPEWAQDLEDQLIAELDAEGYYEEDFAVYQITSEKKLSTKARKKLKASTFCGPNRSFPVPDCAHVTAALRLLGRYKGPGNKASIRKCVLAKAKKMKCKTSTDKKKEDTSQSPALKEIQANHDTIHEEYRALKDSGKLTLAKRQALVGRHLKVTESLYALTGEPHSAEDELDSATWSFLK
jgi:hypothetical protein